MAKHAAADTSTQADTYRPKHESITPSANDARRIVGRLQTQRVVGR